jgi:hypothetical protein
MAIVQSRYSSQRRIRSTVRIRSAPLTFAQPGAAKRAWDEVPLMQWILLLRAPAEFLCPGAHAVGEILITMRAQR